MESIRGSQWLQRGAREARSGGGRCWPREAARSSELGTGSGGCGDPGGIKLALVVHDVRKGEAILLVRFAWPEAAW
jgi:hypothetical protein